VPIIAARRLPSQHVFGQYLAALRAADARESLLVVAGDSAQPPGPYLDAASVIGSEMLEKHGVRRASVAGPIPAVSRWSRHAVCPALMRTRDARSFCARWIVARTGPSVPDSVLSWC
jgi:hypothetical protein